jgi:hypothetical protein
VSSVIRATLTGPDVELGRIPAADIAKLIMGLQQALAAAASVVARQERKSPTGRHPQAIEAASRLRFVGVEAGSVAGLLALPDVESEDDQDLGFEVQHLAEHAFDRLVAALSAPEGDVDRALARAVSRLADELNIGERNATLRLGYRDRRRPEGVVDRDVRIRMRRIARRRSQRRVDSVTGSLVEADFEKHSARLQPQVGQPITVMFDEEHADEIQEALRHTTEIVGDVTYDPDARIAQRVALRILGREEQLSLIEAGSGSFWHQPSVAELAHSQGIEGPQDVDSLRTDIPPTPEELEAFFAVDDE